MLMQLSTFCFYLKWKHDVEIEMFKYFVYENNTAIPIKSSCLSCDRIHYIWGSFTFRKSVYIPIIICELYFSILVIHLSCNYGKNITISIFSTITFTTVKFLRAKQEIACLDYASHARRPVSALLFITHKTIILLLNYEPAILS